MRGIITDGQKKKVWRSRCGSLGDEKGAGKDC